MEIENNNPIIENEQVETDFRAIESKSDENKSIALCESKTHCMVCTSGFVDQINALRNKFTLVALSEYLKKEFDVELSKDQLWRHFGRYTVALRQASTEKAYELFRVESATLAVHQKQTLFLAATTFQELCKRIENGTLELTVEHYEKLMNLYYKILRDPDDAIAPDMMEVYMRAWKNYRVPLAQSSFVLPADDGGAGGHPPAGATL